MVNNNTKYITENIRALTKVQWLIIKELLKHDGIQRDDICKIISKARTTVFDNLKKMMKMDLVYNEEEDRDTRGRPRIYWYANKNAFEIDE